MRGTGILLLLSFTGGTSASVAAAEEIAAERRADASVYQVQGFDAVATGIAGRVAVRVGPAWSVRATGPATAIARLRVEHDKGALRLSSRERWQGRPREEDRQVRVTVTMPRLVKASVGGSGSMTVDRVSGPYLRASVGGSGSLALGDVALGELNVSIGGSGGVTAAGRAGRLKISAAGSGNLSAAGLHAASATVAVAGSGTIRAAVNGDATVAVAGSGSVDLGRAARCSVRRAGSGRVVCGG